MSHFSHGHFDNDLLEQMDQTAPRTSGRYDIRQTLGLRVNFRMSKPNLRASDSADLWDNVA